MKHSYDPETPPVSAAHDNPPPSNSASGAPLRREIALEFPIGDGRTGRCQACLFRVADAASADDECLIVALIEAPPGGGGFHLSLYAGAIAGALCVRERIPPDRLLYIDHDREAGARMSEWAILLGPQALYAFTTMVSQGTFSGDTFHLVAFDFEAGALVHPRFTPLSRLDVETFIGGPLEG